MNAVVTALLWAIYLVSLFFGVFWLLVFLEKGSGSESSKKQIKYPMVTVAIPAWNEEDVIEGTIKSILDLNYKKEKLQVIVVNDGSTDKTPEIVEKIKKQHPSLELINQENAGKGAAVNTALAKAKGEFFVCMDADSFIEKDALKKLIPRFENKEVAAVLPSLKVKNPKNLLQKMQWYEYIINMFYKELMAKLNCVHVTPGPFSVYRTSILKEVGGFDPDRNLTEDLEIALRLQSKNYKIIQVLDTEVETIAPDNFKQLYKQRNRWYKGAIINALKYKYMIFNKKFGDFGMVQMPTILVSGIIALVLITTMIYYSLKPQISFLYHLFFIDFDIWTLIHSYQFNFHYLDLDFMTILVAVIMLVITFYVMKKSHTVTKEKITKHGCGSLIFYLAMYFIILSIMWVGISADLLLRRKQKW